MNSRVVTGEPAGTFHRDGSILRYTFTERLHHWLGAAFYVYCLVTGLAFWSPYFFWLAILVGGSRTFPQHGVVALASEDEGETWTEEWREV